MAEKRIAAWLAREASLGRVYTCGSQSLGGYPFRIEVRCRDAHAELQNLQPPLSIKTGDLVIAAQVYQPTLLLSEFAGPMSIGAPGQPASMLANWSLAQTSVSGRPRAPERISIVFDDPVLDRTEANGRQNILRGKRIELHARVIGGSPSDHPVLDVALRAVATIAPTLHPLLAEPVDAEIATTWRGLTDLSPKLFTARLRELQAAGGRIDVTSARVSQGEAIAVATGSLGLTSSGRLDGELRVTTVGLEKVLVALGVDRLAPPGGTVDKIGAALDRLSPGLGAVAREKAGVGIAAGVNLLGQPAEIDGRRAVKLPLRFTDGAVSLGPLSLGQTPPLF
ncbi:MAG: DUF2125 domain-containing protein [Rhizobiales bacterium]|nr:DUF2125 domain-containing protein [Hyphomicrobiales bacterium]